jgi:putative transposase
MTHDDDGRVAELLARLGDGDTKELFRRLLEVGMQELIDAELTAAIGAAPHERIETRSNQRNGSRSRLLSTPAGDVELRIPKVRVGSFFPSLLEPRRRVDKALWGVIMTAYMTGTSTRKVDDLVRALGCESGVSKSTVSRICAGIDDEVAVFRRRRLDHVSFSYVYLDATYIKARINHRIISRAVVVATGVTGNGDREVLGVDVGDSEDEVFWTAFLRGLKDRGLSEVRLVVSDAHAGLKASIPRVLAGASWQRCKVHLMRNILGTVTSASKDMVAATVRTIFAQPSAEACRTQLHEVVRILDGQFPKAAAILEGAEADVLAHTAFPRSHWRKIASTNPLERINKEIPVFHWSMPKGPRRWLLRSVIVPRSDSKEISTPRLRWLSSV